jgi:hypothetical protein
VFSSFFNSGVRVLFTSRVSAVKVVIRETGETTSPFGHFVFMERESFHTGIDIPSDIHNFSNASTHSCNADNCHGSPLSAIQFQDQAIDSKSDTYADIRFVIDSHIAILHEAAGFITANGVLSPEVITSPIIHSKP